MTLHKTLACLTTAGLARLLGACLCLADDSPKPAAPGTLLIVDNTGKEQTVKSWKFTQGTRHLTWLAPGTSGKEPEAKPEPKTDPKEEKNPKAKAVQRATPKRPA